MVSEKQLEELGVVNWSVLAKDFEGADLILGNGFSLNITGHFDYNSLFEKFLENRNPEERNMFKKFGTSSFEFILEKLLNIEICFVTFSTRARINIWHNLYRLAPYCNIK